MKIIKLKTNNSYEKIINKQLNFIEKQSFKTVKNNFSKNSNIDEIDRLEIENRSIELSNLVIDILRKDDFKILKNFNGKSKLTTYLTTIIARQFVDIIRKKLGRSREKDRAKNFGYLGIKIYQSIFIEKHSINDFLNSQKFENEQNVSVHDIENIIDSIRGKKKFNKNDISNFPESPVKKGFINGEKMDIIIPYNKTPETLFKNEEKDQFIRKSLKLILSKLSEEEKFILKLRFYNNDEKKLIYDDISKLLNINKKDVYKKINRILNKCKKILNQNGVEINDIF